MRVLHIHTLLLYYERMKLSVIITTYNRADTLKTCLEKLMVQTGVDFEVIVVDDGSTDHTGEVVNKFVVGQARTTHHAPRTPEIRYVKQSNARQGAARNNGLKHATGDIILFGQDDIFMEPGFLMQHMDVHNQHPGEDVVCLGYTTWDPALKINSYMKFLESSGWQFAYFILKRGFIDHPEPYKFFYTSNISVKKSILKGEKFNESFKEYGWEDIELGYRLWKNKSMRIYYEPDAAALHHHEIPEDSIEKRMQTVGRTAVQFEKLQPNVKVIPSGLKGLLISLTCNAITLPLVRLLGKTRYYKFKSWYEFNKGVRSAR